MTGSNILYDKLLPWSALIASFAFVATIVISN
jgi:hypothetical protein